MKKIQGDSLRGHLETLILAVLGRGRAHGFAVLRPLESEGAGALRLREGTVCPALYCLEEAGHVRAEWEDGKQRRRGLRRIIEQTDSDDGRSDNAADLDGDGGLASSTLEKPASTQFITRLSRLVRSLIGQSMRGICSA